MNQWAEILSLAQSVLPPRSLASVTEIAQLGKGPFGVLVSTIISLRTRDQVTLPRSSVFLSQAPTPCSVVNLPIQTLEELIYPAAFFRIKAKNILEISRILLERWDGRVPDNLEDLLSLPGVGRKTATLVLGLGYGIPAVCVDIHVHRITNRMGIIQTKNTDQTEQALMDRVPEELWIRLNDTLVRFGQQICTPQSPRCSICPLINSCLKVGVSRSR